MGKVSALITPSVLIWSRKGAGLSIEQLAKKTKIKEEHLQEFEAGTRKPSVPQLRKIAKVFKRPIAIFFLPEPPKSFDAVKDFRVMHGKNDTEYSTELLLEIRKAYERRFIALELFEALEVELPPKPSLRFHVDDDPSRCAEKLRKWISLDLNAQFSWKNNYQALSEWRSHIEATGILVFQASGVEVSEMRGFSISKNPLPVVVVNIKDSPTARIFSMIHELSHILLHEGGVCDLHEDDNRSHNKVEIFCNAVAGNALVPEASLLNLDIVKGVQENELLSEIRINQLARRYLVSADVIVRRLFDLGRISLRGYKNAQKGISERFLLHSAKTSGGFATPDQRAVAQVGKTYARLVMNSYDEQRISSSAVSDYLGVRLKHLESIRDRIQGAFVEV